MLNRDAVTVPSLPNPNIRVRKGASMVSEISEKVAESRFSEKYPTTSLGYFLMYEKMIRRLLM
jgi:hypothetical protein